MRPRGVCAMSVATAIDVVHISSAPSLPASLPRGERGGRTSLVGGFVGGAVCATAMRAPRHAGIGMHSRKSAQLGCTAAVVHQSCCEARCICRGALHAPSWCVRDVGCLCRPPPLSQPLSREGREEAGRFEAEDLLLALLVRLRCVRRPLCQTSCLPLRNIGSSAFRKDKYA